MTLRTLAAALCGTAALAAPAAAGAQAPVSTNADQVACNAGVFTTGGGVQHGSYELRLPDLAISLRTVTEAAGSDACDPPA